MRGTERKKNEGNEQSFLDPVNSIKHTKIHKMEAPEEEEWDKKLKRIFKVKWPKLPKLHDKY